MRDTGSPAGRTYTVTVSPAFLADVVPDSVTESPKMAMLRFAAIVTERCTAGATVIVPANALSFVVGSLYANVPGVGNGHDDDCCGCSASLQVVLSTTGVLYRVGVLPADRAPGLDRDVFGVEARLADVDAGRLGNGGR